MGLCEIIDTLDKLITSENPISEIKPVLISLREQAEALDAELESLKTKYSSLEKQYSELEAEIARVKARQVQPRIGTPPGF